MRGSSLVLALVACSALAAHQAQPPAPPTFRTATNLVTIDAVVLDRDGRHVTDLTREDFEVIAQGERQIVRQAVYVPLAAGPVTASLADPDTPAAAPAATEAAAPARRLGPDPRAQVRASARIIAIVVDDLGLSFRSVADVRRALTKFVDEQVQPGDTVAILRTGAGVGSLQQFTSDKRLLRAAIDRLRWTILSRSGVSAFTPIVPPDAAGGPGNAGSGTAEVSDEDSIEGLRTSMLATSSLDALGYVIRGVERLPGRKSVVFVSEGMRLHNRPEGFETQGNSRVWNAFTRVMDRANRAGVVVYTMDARGLETGGLTAEDNPQTAAARPGGPGSGVDQAPIFNQQILDARTSRLDFLLDSQEGLLYMAEQTGGFAVLNNNDLAGGFGRVLADLRGYYLLGFESSKPFDRGWDAGRIRIRVKRPGLRVRARQGFFGPADPDRRTENESGDPLVLAALSPFGAGDLDVRLTALFAHDAAAGSFVRSMFYVDPQAVQFDAADGRHAAKLTLLLVTVGDNGRLLSQFRRTVDLDLTEAELQVVRERGVLYHARVPIKEPGGYQLRAAVRDEKSGRLGSGSQFFEAPRVGRKRLALSGIVMQGHAANGAALAAPPGGPLSGGGADGAPAPLEAVDALFSEPGIRIFKPGADAVYTCEIYDGVSDDGRQLATFATLLRDGREVFRSQPTPVSAREKKGDIRVVPVAGRLSLGRQMPRGPYTLQVTVAEARSGRTLRQTSQWVEFEVR